MESKRRVVLFGSSGFVGSHIAAAVRDFELVMPEWPAVDMTKPDSLRGAILPGDVVVNAAGYANSTDTTPQGRELFQSANVDGVRNLADAAVSAGAAQLVHISSVAAMGRLEGDGITEDMSGPIRSPYAQSKLEGEQVLSAYADSLPLTILRPTSVFGEGRGLAMTLCKLVSKGVVPLPIGGRALIPFTYIGNIAHSVTLALGDEICFGRTFIIGDRSSYRLRDIVTEIGTAMGLSVRIVSLPRSVALAGTVLLEGLAGASGKPPLLDRFRLDTLTRSVSYSIRAFEDATGFSQPYDLESAIDRIAKWYLAERSTKGDAG